jgi:hypothetical protein
MLLGILNSQAAGGGGGAYDLLETTTLATETETVTFSSLNTLASGYDHLQIRMVVRGGSGDNIGVRLNLDETSSYAYHRLRGNGSTVVSSASTSDTQIMGLEMPTSGYVSNSFGAIVMDILDFSSSVKNTTIRALGGHAADGNRIALLSGLYNDTDAVTSVSINGRGTGLGAGCRFSLYGIKGA